MSNNDDLTSIKDWLEEAEQQYGERIEAIVVGKHDDAPPMPDENRVLSRADGLAKLSQRFDDGLGSPDCCPMYAWTATRVFFIAEYDGATELACISRNPVDCVPRFG